MRFDGGDLSLTIAGRRVTVAIDRNARRVHALAAVLRRGFFRGRKTRDGVLGWFPGRFSYTSSRPRFRREVYPYVDEHHYAGGDVE